VGKKQSELRGSLHLLRLAQPLHDIPAIIHKVSRRIKRNPPKAGIRDRLTADLRNFHQWSPIIMLAKYI
jgi:hypothetical protein